MKIKRVWRYDERLRWFRLFRLLWTTGKGPGTGEGASHKPSFALVPRWWLLLRESGRWDLFLLGVRISWERSLGGHHV